MTNPTHSTEKYWNGLEQLMAANLKSTMKPASPQAVDLVNHPPHYTSDPSGVECIQITQHRNFCVGNAIKYLWRAGLKDGDGGIQAKTIEDLKKAVFYINQEITRLEGQP